MNPKELEPLAVLSESIELQRKSADSMQLARVAMRSRLDERTPPVNQETDPRPFEEQFKDLWQRVGNLGEGEARTTGVSVEKVHTVNGTTPGGTPITIELSLARNGEEDHPAFGDTAIIAHWFLAQTAEELYYETLFLRGIRENPSDDTIQAIARIEETLSEAEKMYALSNPKNI